MQVLFARAHPRLGSPLMRGLMLLVANIVSPLLPQSRCFGVRRALYRAAKVQIAPTAKVNGTARIHFPNARIGERTWIGPGAQIIPTAASEVSIGADCDIAPEVMFATGSHELGGPERRGGPGFSKPISIGDGTWVGARATFLAGSSVGRGCMVAAGALVRDVFPDNVMIAGVPARVIRKLPA